MNGDYVPDYNGTEDSEDEIAEDQSLWWQGAMAYLVQNSWQGVGAYCNLDLSFREIPWGLYPMHHPLQRVARQGA